MTVVHPQHLVMEIRHEVRRQYDATLQGNYNADTAKMTTLLEHVTVHVNPEHTSIVATLPDTAAARERGQALLLSLVSPLCGKYGLLYDDPTSTRITVQLP